MPPAFRHPKRCGLHRIACIALYRALLRQCTAVPFTREQNVGLQNVVRHIFRKQTNLQGLKRLTTTFTQGYDALRHLHAATTGSPESTSNLLTLLARTPSKILHPPPPPPSPSPPKPAPSNPQTPPELLTRHPLAPLPPGHKFLEVRPRPTVSGIRRVPKMVSANGIPMLRVKKPEPLVLGRIIKRMVMQKEKRILLRERLVAEPMWRAEWEDEWDDIVAVVREETRGEVEGEEEGREIDGSRWTWALREVVRELDVAGVRFGVENRETARRMMEIIDQERALAEKERVERKRAKNLAKRERRRQREAGAEAMSDEHAA